MMGNETAGRKPNYRSECLDAGSARDWHTFKQDITLEGTDINASVCTYSDSGCSADESCQTIGNGTTTDISGLTNSQYAQVYYEFLAFSEPAYDANSTLNAYWLLGLSASQPSSVTQINLTSYPFNKECPDHPAWCANTTDRTPRFNITTDTSAWCRISDTDEDYGDMATDCTQWDEDFNLTHECEIPDNFTLGKNMLVYFACNSTIDGTEKASPVGNDHTANLTVQFQLRGTAFDLVPEMQQNITVVAWKQESQTVHAIIQDTNATGNFTFYLEEYTNVTVFGYNEQNISLGGAASPHIDVT
jgi:hypothetical protein